MSGFDISDVKSSRSRRPSLLFIVILVLILGVLAATLIPAMGGYCRCSILAEVNSNAKFIHNAAETWISEYEKAGYPIEGSFLTKPIDRETLLSADPLGMGVALPDSVTDLRLGLSLHGYRSEDENNYQGYSVIYIEDGKAVQTWWTYGKVVHHNNLNHRKWREKNNVHIIGGYGSYYHANYENTDTKTPTFKNINDITPEILEEFKRSNV